MYTFRSFDFSLFQLRIATVVENFQDVMLFFKLHMLVKHFGSGQTILENKRYEWSS